MLLTLLAALLAAAAPPHPAAPSYGPPGRWVEEVRLPDPLPEAGSEATDPLLIDEQLRLGSGRARYFHRATRVVRQSGVDEVAQLEIEWNPSYEQLQLHSARVLRGGASRDVLEPTKVKLVDMEPQLEDRILDGRRTAFLLIDDVRPGDVVEYAFTIEGENPLFRGRSGAFRQLGAQQALRRFRLRILLPQGPEPRLRLLGGAPEPRRRDLASGSDYLWDLSDLKRVEHEDSVPGWFNPLPLVQLSDFADWAAVTEQVLPLFEAPRQLSPELASLVEPWRRLPEEKRLLQALRFTQDEIRYVGVELGISSHQPHSPTEVLAHRYGDCKDKALLLTTMLRALGLEADVALVNTRSRRALDGWLPTPLAFDHAIVHARLGDRSLWLDGTSSSQRGGLEELTSAPEERALIVKRGNAALTTIPVLEPQQPLEEVEQRYDASGAEGPVPYTVTTLYRGPLADQFRSYLGITGRTELARSYLNHYARQDPHIEQVAPLEVEDRPEKNEVRLIERYRIPDFWTDDQRDFFAELLHESLRRPRVVQRKQPLAVPHPVWAVERTEVELPAGDSRLRSADDHVASPAFDYKFEARPSGSRLSLRRELRSLASAVEVKDVEGHLKAIDQLEEVATYRVRRPQLFAHRRAGKAGDGHDDPAALFVVVGFICVGALMLGANPLARLRARLRRNRRQRELQVEKGSAAGVPLVASTRLSLEAELLKKRCHCGGRMARLSEDWSKDEPVARLADESVLSARLRCRACEDRELVYYVLRQ